MTNDEITIGILAGGKARRMNNADKGLVKFKNKRFIDHILDEINKDFVNIIIRGWYVLVSNFGGICCLRDIRQRHFNCLLLCLGV